MSDQSVATTSSTSLSDDKREQRMKKFRELHLKRTEANRLNHKEVVAENQRQQLPHNWAKKQEWAQHKLSEEHKRSACALNNEDYDRIKVLDIQADDAERAHWKRATKRNPDPGFSDYETATARQYNRLTKEFRPDLIEYQKSKDKLGEHVFYANHNTIVQGVHTDTKEGVDRMVDDVNKQIDKRAKYSRRRRFDDDADVDYINERNMKFNKKLDRFYGQYTNEIKQNLERGTAV